MIEIFIMLFLIFITEIKISFSLVLCVKLVCIFLKAKQDFINKKSKPSRRSARLRTNPEKKNRIYIFIIIIY